jgi:transaldolase
MGKPLILLDRDGVLNYAVVDPEHGTIDSPLHPSQVSLIPGVGKALARLTAAGYGLAIVTNQPAAAKKKTTRANLQAVHEAVVAGVSSEGGRILSSHICFHRSEDACACRKPKPGLILEALECNPGFDRVGAWMVGDGVTDVQAGAALGLQTAFLGPRKCDACKIVGLYELTPTWWGADLPAFADHLLANEGPPAMIVARPRETVADPAPSRNRLRVKVFADGANLESMLALAGDPLIKGFTTNPTLMRQSGVKEYTIFSRQVLEAIPDKPISFEVLADDPQEIRRQALLIARWGKNVYVKIPVTNSEGVPLAALVNDLSHQGVKINVTAVFTLEQVAATCQALKGGAPSVVSVFAGRIADSGQDPVPHMRVALSICRSVDDAIELLWASPREILNVVQADEIGVDIITVTEAIRTKLHLLGKDLTEFSRETVLMFKKDGESAGFRL